jgi:hypothetical protein
MRGSVSFDEAIEKSITNGFSSFITPYVLSLREVKSQQGTNLLPYRSGWKTLNCEDDQAAMSDIMNKTVEQSQEIEENSQLKYILSRVILKI